MESALWEYMDEGRPEDDVSVIVRLHPDRPIPPGLRIITRFGQVVTARLARRDIPRLRAEVASMKRPQDYSPALWQDDEADGEDDLDLRPTDQRRSEGLPGGKGVVLCHLDWGLDFTHPAFRRADGRTRLIKLWDQGAPYDPAFPNRYGFGRIHDRAEIDRALTQANPLAALGYRWWMSDAGAGSHGTHTMGISGGSPVPGLPTGIAPEADLVFVDLTTHTTEGPQPLGSSSDLLEGVDFADRIAGNRPLVVNASLGRQAGQHDGLTLTEQALDHFVRSRAGRVMTLSCGNYHTKQAHAQVSLQPGDTHALVVEMAAGSRKAEVDLWYPRSDALQISVTGPDGLQVGPLGPDARAELQVAGRRVGKVYHRSDDPNNGDHQVSLYLDGTAPAGRWSIDLTALTIGDGRVHAWIERDPLGTGRLRFTGDEEEARSTLGTICNGFATLAVAAHDGHQPQRPPGAFSSEGPTRDGRTGRPTLACAGVQVLSARSTRRDGTATPLGTRKSGTSMAAPFAAGAAALVLQVAPHALQIDDIRALLVTTADPVPEAQRERFGGGHLNLTAALDAARKVPPRPPAPRALPPLAPRAQVFHPSLMETAMPTPDSDLDIEGDWTQIDCDADGEAEWAAGGDAGLDGLEAEGWALTETDDAEARHRHGGYRPLPFQFQIPLGGGGGGLGLALPIGGMGSPFALSLPLGGQVAPAAIPVAVPVAVPKLDPVTTALDLPDAAGCDCDHGEAADLAEEADLAEATWSDLGDHGADRRYGGERLMAVVNAVSDQAFDTHGHMLETLQDQMAEDTVRLPVPQLYDLFQKLANGDPAPLQLMGQRVSVVARPGARLNGQHPRRGDVMLRTCPGQRFVQMSFVTGPDLLAERRLDGRGWRAEGMGAPLPGHYVQVVELWPQRRDEATRFARRLSDADHVVAPDTMLLRLDPEGVATEDAPVAAGGLTVDHVPMLAGHRGTPPDLMLRWNAMPAGTAEVDIVVHLHGYSGRGAAMRIDRDKMPRSGLDFANPDAPGETGRTAPTLAILPRGNFFDGRTHMGYDFPAVVAAGGLASLIRLALAEFARATGLAARPGRLILTAHSGGGAPLMRLLSEHDPDEVYCFDALYNPPEALMRWAQRRMQGPSAATSALRVLFRAGEGTAAHSHAVAAQLARAAGGQAALAARFRVEAVHTPHNDIPRTYGWRLLADAGADLPGHRAPSRPAQPAHSGHPAHPAPAAPPSRPEVHGGSGLAQDGVSRLAAATFANAAELDAYFPGGFATWFNSTLSGHAPFARPGGGGALHVPTGAAPRARFRAFWDNLQAAYRQPRISLLEFASLMAIVMNETDGDFSGHVESSGRGGGGRTDARGRHPGLAYFFDRIELRPGHFKASYNHLSGGRTAASLFDDPLYIRAHGSKGGADRLAGHGGDFGGAWAGRFYPADQGFSTLETDPATAFIREADFYKFRGRGIIQTTGRESYRHIVHAIKAYRGSDPVLTAAATAWSALRDDDICTASTNEDWQRLFAVPMVLGLAFALHSPRYRMMSHDAQVLNAVPAEGHQGQSGSIYLMGRRISGSHDYGAHLYRDRVLGMLGAMLTLPLSGHTGPAPAAPPHQEPEHPQQRPTPAPTPAPTAGRPRGSVPAPDADTARAQWAAHPRAHQFFAQGEAQYLEFAPMFAQRGVGDAAEYLANSITGLTFFGRRNPGHRGLVAPLAAAEAALAGHALTPPLTSFGCLNVRRIAGTDRLSFHALGRAVDLNPTSNPHIKSPEDFAVIQAVTGLDLRRERNPARLCEASQHFQRDFTPDWVASQTDPRITSLLQHQSTRQRLTSYARHGFCTLDPALIAALIAAGLNWGGSWTSSKDFMHFELP